MKKTLIGILALTLCVVMLTASLASCTAGDKIKTGASDAWEKVKDGAEDIYNSVTDNSTGEIELDPISSAYIRLASNVVPTGSGDANYKTKLTASDFANCTVATNGVGANYVTYEQRVGSITAVTGAEQADYWTATAGEKPIVAVDGNFSYICVVLPNGYNDAATWAAAATDFSVTVSPVIVKELVATVLPEDATNKAVEWSVSVETNPDEVEIDPADYIRILTFEGLWENRVQVLALAPFLGIEFKITCTTVVGGYTADCIVKYKGEPSTLNLYTENSDGSRNYISEQIDLLSGNTYEINLELGNLFNTVGSDYGQFEVVQGYTTGSYVGEIWTTSGYTGQDTTIDGSQLGSLLFNQKIEGDVLKLYDLISVVDYVYPRAPSVGVKYKSGIENVVFHIEVRDSVSGLSQTLSFRILPTVSSVSLSDSTIEF